MYTLFLYKCILCIFRVVHIYTWGSTTINQISRFFFIFMYVADLGSSAVSCQIISMKIDRDIPEIRYCNGLLACMDCIMFEYESLSGLEFFKPPRPPPNNNSC